jgi:hypothetical protein
VTTPTAVPAPVRNAALAVWVLLGLVLLRVVLTVSFTDDLIDKFLEGHQSAKGMPREFAEKLAPNYTGVAIVSLAFAVVLALSAVFLPKGAGWARIVAIVFASLSAIGVVLSLLAPTLIVLLLINLAVAAVSIAIIVLLAGGEAGRFFASN